VIDVSEWKSEGGPCRRQCDVDMKTMVCKSCGMCYKRVDEK